MNGGTSGCSPSCAVGTGATRLFGAVATDQQQARRLGRLRIGVPEGLVHLEALRQQRRLEQHLAPLGVVLERRDYLSASSLLQALNGGEIDFCGGGGTPSVFAQAAELLFVRVARDQYTNPGGEAVLVASDGPIQRLEDLRGCRVAVEEGSTAHYVLVRVLRLVCLEPDAVEIVFLPQGARFAGRGSLRQHRQASVMS